MLNTAIVVLGYLGASIVRKTDVSNDPTNQEELDQLDYDAPRRYTWDEYQSAIEPSLRKLGLRMIRYKRNICLQNSDYIMTIDFFNSLANRDQWITYRQNLRDFPEEVKTIVWKVPGKEVDWDATGFPKEPPIIKNT